MVNARIGGGSISTPAGESPEGKSGTEGMILPMD
jgi:hypothetical protein